MTGNREKQTTGLADLEKRLGHVFDDRDLIGQALTHSSATRNRSHSNERLEFLGDRVLGLVIAEMLLDRFPDEDEGALGYRLPALVRRESLARVGEAIGLAEHIVMSDGEEETGGRQKEGVIADACEAVIGALFLDGGLQAAGRFIGVHWEQLIGEDLTPPKDPKTELQEWAQAASLPLPVYETIGRHGPDHAPTFTVSVSVADGEPESGVGTSKQAAEQAAAQALLARLTGHE